MKSRKYIMDIIVGSMPKIVVKSGNLRYNFRCQLNAVHEALNANEDSIAMCFYVKKGISNPRPCIHFLNINSDGEYVDNTIGRWSETFDYYLVRKIDKESFFDIDNIFLSYRREIRNRIPFYIRWFDDNEF